jgi:hypothetical protein
VAAGLPHFRPLRSAPHLRQSPDRGAGRHLHVAHQLGHAKMTTTLLFYGHWFPKGDRRYVEQMEAVRASAVPLKLPVPHDDAGAVLDADEAPNDGWFMAPLRHHKRIRRSRSPRSA